MMNRLFLLATLVAFIFAGYAFMPANNPTKEVQRIRFQQPDLDFVLINKTGYAIDDVYMRPTGTTEWGEDIFQGNSLPNGNKIKLVFHPKASAEQWDLKLGWEGYTTDNDVFWKGLDLTKIEELTLFYDEATGKTRAEIGRAHV